jgi:hypothetical protein
MSGRIADNKLSNISQNILQISALLLEAIFDSPEFGTKRRVDTELVEELHSKLRTKLELTPATQQKPQLQTSSRSSVDPSIVVLPPQAGSGLDQAAVMKMMREMQEQIAELRKKNEDLENTTQQLKEELKTKDSSDIDSEVSAGNQNLPEDKANLARDLVVLLRIMN